MAGCEFGLPGGGKDYEELEIPGFVLTFQTARDIYQVRVGGGHAVVCEEGLKAIAGAREREVLEANVEPAIPIPSDPYKKQLVSQAMADLAKRLSVEETAIELVEQMDVVWSDSSLGCPRPGMSYIQVLHEGYLIRFRASKRIYEYHGGGRQGPFLCENPEGTKPRLK